MSHFPISKKPCILISRLINNLNTIPTKIQESHLASMLLSFVYPMNHLVKIES